MKIHRLDTECNRTENKLDPQKYIQLTFDSATEAISGIIFNKECGSNCTSIGCSKDHLIKYYIRVNHAIKGGISGLGKTAVWLSTYLTGRRPWIPSTSWHKPGMMAKFYNSSTLYVEAGGPEFKVIFYILISNTV